MLVIFTCSLTLHLVPKIVYKLIILSAIFVTCVAINLFAFYNLLSFYGALIILVTMFFFHIVELIGYYNKIIDLDKNLLEAFTDGDIAKFSLLIEQNINIERFSIFLRKSLDKNMNDEQLKIMKMMLISPIIDGIDVYGLRLALELASKNKWVEEAEIILSSHNIVKFKNINLNYALQLACENKLETIARIILTYPMAYRISPFSLGYSLKVACKNKLDEIAKIILTSPMAERISPFSLGYSLQVACENKLEPVVKKMLTPSIVANIGGIFLSSALELALNKKWIEQITMMLSIPIIDRIDGFYSGDALEEAHKNGFIHQLKEISPSNIDKIYNLYLGITLLKSCKNKLKEITKKMLTPLNIDKINYRYFSEALVSCCKNGWLEEVQIMLNYPIKIHYIFLFDALTEACQNGWLEEVKFMLNYPNPFKKEYQYIFWNICKANRTEIALALLEKTYIKQEVSILSNIARYATFNQKNIELMQKIMFDIFNFDYNIFIDAYNYKNIELLMFLFNYKSNLLAQLYQENQEEFIKIVQPLVMKKICNKIRDGIGINLYCSERIKEDNLRKDFLTNSLLLLEEEKIFDFSDQSAASLSKKDLYSLILNNIFNQAIHIADRLLQYGSSNKFQILSSDLLHYLFQFIISDEEYYFIWQYPQFSRLFACILKPRVVSTSGIDIEQKEDYSSNSLNLL